MTHKQKLKQLDSLLAPFVSLANGLALQLSGFFHHFREKQMPSPCHARRVVIAKFEGLGSIVYAAGLVAALRRTLPNIEEVVFFTQETNRDFVSRIDGVDKVVGLNTQNLMTAFWTWFRALSLCRADLYIDLEVYSHFSAFTATATCSWWRAGFFRESANYRTGLFTHSIFFNANRHISENYLQVLRALDVACSETKVPKLRISAPERERLSAFIDFPSHWKWLAVNPHASDLLLERRWPKELFARAIESLLLQNPNLGIIITGSAKENACSEEIVSSIPAKWQKSIRNLSGKLNIGEFLALLEASDVLLTNDTGPLHIALMLGTPTVSLWGPGTPLHYGPQNLSANIVFYQNVFCSPCLYQTSPPPCRGDNFCMSSIPVESVVEAALQLINRLSVSREGLTISPAPVQKYSDGRYLAVATNHLKRKPLL